MLQKGEKEGVRAGLFTLFLCFGLFAQAQTDKENEWYSNHYMNNDNWIYFRDIALERGLYMATVPIDDLSDGRITSLHGSYFLNNIFGFRSGVSLITDLNDDSPYLKIPFLLALRSRTFQTSVVESETFKEFIRNLIWYIIPKRCEINMGPSLGYIWNNKPDWAYSIDSNFRIGFQFGRIGLNGNIGVNYLLSKNFIGSYFIYAKRSRPVWYVNLSAGFSFRL
jgi:hypothetical protein